jgi:hypothetical protein
MSSAAPERGSATHERLNERFMDTQRTVEYEVDTSDDATPLEVLFYVVGILMIPLVPIIMVTVFTPFSGVSH